MPPSASTIFASLAGRWRLTRRISDRHNQLQADVEGTATFSAAPSEASELHYDEQVTVRWSHGERSTASKKYRYRLNSVDESITQFNCVGDAQTELDKMYDLRFEAKGGSRLVAKGDFLCGQDRYKASYDFAASLDRFRLDYEVRGPKKDYSTFTVYSRALEE